MELVDIQHDIVWALKPNRVTSYFGSQVPDKKLTTAVFGFLFQEHELLLTKNQLGWTLPGGHIEIDEVIETALMREALEETGVVIKVLEPVGYVEIEVLCPKPHQYNYPYPKSYLQFFLGEIVEVPPFIPQHESSDRQFFDRKSVEGMDWFLEFPKFYSLIFDNILKDERAKGKYKI